MTTTNLLVVASNRVQSMSMDPVAQDLLWREAAGLPKPATVNDVLTVLDREPTPQAVVTSMVRSLDEHTPEWLEENLARFQRAGQVAALRVALEHAGRNDAATHRGRTAAARFELLAGPVADAIARLGAVVKALPDGDAVLSPEANIDAGTTAELAETRDLLTRIGTMVGSLPTEGGRRPMSRWALSLVDVPQVEPARVDRFGMPVLNPSPARDAVIRACEVDDLDRLLIDVLRDQYPNLTLRLVESRAEHHQRAERVHQAHLTTAGERP